MPIEKLSFTVPNDWTLNDQTNYLQKKLNELIDAYNTREQDRSEQMARIIDKQAQFEKKVIEQFTDFFEMFDEVAKEYSSMQRGIEILHEKFYEIIDSNSATQPKEEEPELLTCPFCHKEKYMEVLERNNGKFCVRCLPCRARGSEKDTKQEAISAWNSRK